MNFKVKKRVLQLCACSTLIFWNIPDALAYDSNLEIVQQNKKQISGQVLDSSGMSVIGANVVEKGTTNGVITDLDGNFSLNVSPGAVIEVSFIGFATQEIKVGYNTTFNIVMKEDTEVLDEVVVVGYGTMKKRDLSGAVSQIKSDDLMKGSPTDFTKGLAGKVAGVQVNQSDGAPGGGVSIQIRGTNSFSTSSQPLYIVDGVPFDAGSTPSSDANSNSNQSSNPLSFINPHDIESIEVLKDASATAIYGSRGANGVVIITTKRGQAGREQVEFSANFTMSRVARKIDVLDAYTYALYQNEQQLNDYKYNSKPIGTLPYPTVL